MVSIFWNQAPLGSRLSWSLVLGKLNIMRIYVIAGVQYLLMCAMSLFGTRFFMLLPTRRRLYEVFRLKYPEESRVTRAITYFSAFVVCIPLVSLYLAIVIVSYMVLVAVVLVSVVLSLLVIFLWCVVILVGFFLWFTFYRYPIFEVIYPKVRTWMLHRNARIYRPLPATENVEEARIRVVCLKPGRENESIECELRASTLYETTFDALSYVWGATIIPYKIKVNGKPFYVTSNLYTALQELRHPERERMLWIDAMAINQSDNAEKSSQVQLMQDIYCRASQVIVWLGKSSSSTSRAFDLIKELGTANNEANDLLWAQWTSSTEWRSLKREFNSILEHCWWTRAWIIQEVVLGRHVLVQRGAHKVEWEQLHEIVNCTRFNEDFDGYGHVVGFIQYIQELRSGEPSSRTLFDLAYNFRHQSATFGSDKLYALLGLLSPTGPTLFLPDYSKAPEDVFVEFTLSCLEQSKSLGIIALAAGAELQGVSWCRDWRFENDGFSPTLWFSMYIPPHKEYSASGNHPVSFNADTFRRVLSLQGFTIDTIAKCGDFERELAMVDIKWGDTLLGWERIAGGPWNDDNEAKRSFNRTITADCWTDEPIDWRPRLHLRGMRDPQNENLEFRDDVHMACLNRRFFVTKEGKFGLGPWDAKKGDLVCILLGGSVPFVLRKCKKRELRPSRVDPELMGKPEYFKLVGESYCDGVMYYNGDLTDDIQSKKISLQTYHLL